MEAKDSEPKLRPREAKFRETVLAHEAAFRDILRDVKTQWPDSIPEEVNPDADISTLLQYYKPSIGGGFGFGIGEFAVGPEDDEPTKKDILSLHWNKLNQNEAVLELHDFAPLSGNNHILLYDITPDQPVKYKGEAPGSKIFH